MATRSRTATIVAGVVLLAALGFMSGCQSSRAKAVSLCREYYGDDAVGEPTVLDLPISDVEFVRKYMPGEKNAAILLGLKVEAEHESLGVRNVIFANSPLPVKPQCAFRTHDGDLSDLAEGEMHSAQATRLLVNARVSPPSSQWPPCCM